MRSFKTPLLAITAALSTLAPVVWAQSTPTFPNANWTEVSEGLNTARLLAGKDNMQHFYRACIYDQVYPMYAENVTRPYRFQPKQVFDNLFWVGQGAASSWVVKTSAGLIVVDTLFDANQADIILLAGARGLGLNPADIKYVLLTSEDAGHVGGARYLQDNFGARVIASDATWSAIAKLPNAPQRNITVVDGQRLTVGDTSFDIHLTPGRSVGSLTAIFPVFDKSTRRTAALHSNIAMPTTLAQQQATLSSLTRIAGVTEAAGVDTLLAGYQHHDLGMYNLDRLGYRRAYSRSPKSAADYRDPNPYHMGAERYQRFLQIMSMCTRVAAARNGDILPR